MLIEPVREVTERQAGVGIGPRDLTARAVVTEGARRNRVAHAARGAPTVVARDDEPERTVRRRSHVVGQVVAHVRRRVGEYFRLPDAGRIVQERLVVEREIGRGRHAATTGNPDRAHLGLVERHQGLGRHLGQRK